MWKRDSQFILGWSASTTVAVDDKRLLFLTESVPITFKVQASFSKIEIYDRSAGCELIRQRQEE